MIPHAPPRHPRAYAAFLAIGAVFAFGLLVRQLLDASADAAHPAMVRSDLFAALGSVVMLALIAFVFFGPRRKVGS